MNIWTNIKTWWNAHNLRNPLLILWGIPFWPIMMLCGVLFFLSVWICRFSLTDAKDTLRCFYD